MNYTFRSSLQCLMQGSVATSYLSDTERLAGDVARRHRTSSSVDGESYRNLLDKGDRALTGKRWSNHSVLQIGHIFFI